MINYSICIRTLGRGGEKYSKLLFSIKNLKNKPSEVVIVLPDGYELPQERLGEERFVFCRKGMLEQRIVSYEAANSEYVLLLDDDVEFKEDLVETLYNAVENNGADISFPVYEELLPQKGFRGLNHILTLSAVPIINRTKYYTKVLLTGGYSYPSNVSKCDSDLISESAPGMCVFAKRKVLLDINLRNEYWVEKPEYALRDDTILVYKAHLKGYKTIARKGIDIIHLDNAIGDNTRKAKSAYALGFSQINFWYRFIYKEKNFLMKIVSILAILYWCITTVSITFISSVLKKRFVVVKSLVRGLIDGIKHMKS